MMMSMNDKKILFTFGCTNAPHTAAAPRRHFTSPTAFQTSLCPDKQKNTHHNFL